MSLPVLYSLRNCPYAMRARLAIYKAKYLVELRDVVLNNKPSEMIAASAKATVPILVLEPFKINNVNERKANVIDESIDIMLWALTENDPDNLLRLAPINNSNTSLNSGGINSEKTAEILALISHFDTEFKPSLEAYKCAKRYHEPNLQELRAVCEVTIKNLEQRLNTHSFVLDEHESLADIAILPFIRQFAKVERQWYLQSPYPNVKQWLNRYLQSAMFTQVMAKYPLWTQDQPATIFGG